MPPESVCKIHKTFNFIIASIRSSNVVANNVLFFRFMGLKKSLTGSYFSLKWTTIIIVSIWLCNIVINLPIMFWTEVIELYPTSTRLCVVMVDPSWNVFYMDVLRVIVYLIPMTITWTSYIGIICVSKRSLAKVGPRINYFKRLQIYESILRYTIIVWCAMQWCFCHVSFNWKSAIS